MADSTSRELAIPDDNSSNTTIEPKSGLLDLVGTADMMRQLTIIVALVICVAIAIFIAVWAQEPEYRPLGTYQTQELIETLDYFDQNKIEYRLDGSTILVKDKDFQSINYAKSIIKSIDI